MTDQRAGRSVSFDSLSVGETLAMFPDLLFLVGADGVILDYRGGGSTQLYVAPEVFLGRPLQTVLPPPAADRLGQAVARVSMTQIPAAVDYTLPMPDGEHEFEARLLPVESDTILVVCRDITEAAPSKGLLEGFEKEIVSQAPSAFDAATVDAAPEHELIRKLNDVVSIIIGNTQVARHLTADAGPVRESLDLVLAAGRTLQTLVDRAYVLTRSQRLSGPQPLPPAADEAGAPMGALGPLTAPASLIADCLVMLETRPNVLVEGAKPQTEEALRLLLPRCLAPVMEWSDLRGSKRPPTLLVREIADLTTIEQSRLLRWIEEGERMQTLSTSSTPLFPLVEQGRFLARLFYRLNVVRLDV